MADLSEIVTVQITATTVGVRQAGFGVPLLLSAEPTWTERTRRYTSPAGVAADFATTTLTYKMANAVFSQNPRPNELRVGRLANKPTQRRTITPTAVNLAAYSVRVGATTVTFTADSSATVAEIVTGLIALVNAIPGITLTATGTTTLVLTENAAGTWSDVEVLDPTLLSLVQDHADPGVAADLTAIANQDNSWYGIYNPYASKAMDAAIAAFVEANAKLFVSGSQDVDIILTVPSGATDIAGTLKTSAYKKSAVLYHPNPGAHAVAAWLGRVLCLAAGSETWAFKTLVGVPAVALTATQSSNARGKNANTYEAIAGVNVTRFGTVASGEYIDVSRFIDWIIARIGERVFGLLAGAASKVPFDDTGIAMVARKAESVLIDGVAVKGFRDYQMGPLPKAADISDADRAARHLGPVNFVGFLAGAVHTAAFVGSVVA